jgi:hypothetical protein
MRAAAQVLRDAIRALGGIPAKTDDRQFLELQLVTIGRWVAEDWTRTQHDRNTEATG